MNDMEINFEHLLTMMGYCRENECVEWYISGTGAIDFRTVQFHLCQNYLASPTDDIKWLLQAIQRLKDKHDGLEGKGKGWLK